MNETPKWPAMSLADNPTQPLPAWRQGSQPFRQPNNNQHGPQPRPRARRLSRRAIIISICCVLVLLGILVPGFFVYRNYDAQYQRGKALAQSGMQHMRNAEKLVKQLTTGSLDTPAATQARQEFNSALNDMKNLKNSVEQIPAVASNLPKYGSLLLAAQHIVPLAINLSQAGIIGCDAFILLTSHLHNVASISGQGITRADLTTIKSDVTQIQTILNNSTTQINQLQPADLQAEPRIGPAIATFRADIPTIQVDLQRLQTFLGVAPLLLGVGQNASYLLELLDTTEVRPGGGFIGNYGIATVSNGKLAHIQMQDTYLLDDAYGNTGGTIPTPAQYSWFSLANSWSLRDSNLEADFPTSARYAEQIYHTEGGTVPLQGVLAITPQFIVNLMKLTGPIYVNEYNETVTPQNMINRIHYHQLKAEFGGGDLPSSDGHSSVRKHFTELLFEHFFAKVRQVVPKQITAFIHLVLDAVRAKDVQFYFNQSSAEDLLRLSQNASTVQAPAGDSLFFVDANIISSKANAFMTYMAQDQVTVDTGGTATHHLTLTYSWPISTDNQQNNIGHKTEYDDYLRIYTPPGSTLQKQDGWILRDTSQAYGRRVWAGLFTLFYGETGTVSLTWTVRNAATKDAHGWHYHDLIQRQVGIIWQLNLQVKLPACATIVGKSTPVALKVPNKQNAVFNQKLTADVNVGIDYTC
jgi:exonuclease VII small subunit